MAAVNHPDPLGELAAFPQVPYIDSGGPTFKRKGGE